MTRTKREPSIIDANVPIPETLMSHLKSVIQKLPLDSFKNSWLVDEVFSKFVSSTTAPAALRRLRAINKWLAVEQINEGTNTRLLITHEEYNILPRVSWESFLTTTRNIIRDVLGDVPPDEIFSGSFSGGASTSRKRTDSHPGLKYLGKADITLDALEYASSFIDDEYLWASLGNINNLNIVEGNVLFTVPKNSDIDRCACKEPDINMYYQKGVGRYIRSRLRKFGIDLNDQSHNRDLAREGSISGNLCTLDLSSASDSVTHELVALLLPELWYTCLNALRSKKTLIDGDIHVNEMFSSMGNGFTFELESLLFYALARATAYHTGTPGVISVYGDDIICPTEMSSYIIFVLNYFGFEVNTKKSFTSGSFRESCGGHFYDGSDVTPFYVKAPVSHLVDLIHVCNQIRKWSINSCDFSILDPQLYELWITLSKHVPKRFWGGHDYSFKGRLVSFEKPRKMYRLVPNEKKRNINNDGLYLLWLDSAESRTEVGDKPLTAVTTLTSYKAVKCRDSNFHGALRHTFYQEVMTE